MFCEERDEKLLKVLMQSDTTRRYVDINGKSVSELAKYYEPEMARKIVDFNLTTSKSTDTPVFRQLTDDLLMKLLESGRIPLEIFLKNCSIPGAEKIQAELKTFSEQAAAGQIDPDRLQMLQQAAQQNADPKAMDMLKRYMDAAQ